MTGSEHDDVTVVVPCFDYGSFLGEALASVLGQEGGAPRIVVVDDGSTDPATLAVLADLPAGVELLRQANAGLPAARNAGIARSGTPYVIVLDADDRLPPGALRALRRPLEEDAALGFAYGITRFFGDWEGTMDFPPYDPYRLLYRHIIGSTALMRREVWERTGGYDPRFERYEDWEFWLHALRLGFRGRRVEEVTFEYRRHGSTMVDDARATYRAWYRRIRRKHAALFARAPEFARETDLGLPGRVLYRTLWAWRPVPASVEQRLYGLLLWRPR